MRVLGVPELAVLRDPTELHGAHPAVAQWRDARVGGVLVADEALDLLLVATDLYGGPAAIADDKPHNDAAPVAESLYSSPGSEPSSSTLELSSSSPIVAITGSAGALAFGWILG